MKCFTRVKSNAYAPTSTDIISQNMIFWQMSKHYKRIKSAKKVVDTSAPLHSKVRNAPVKRPKKKTSECLTPSSAGSISKISQQGISQTVDDKSGFCNKEYTLHYINVSEQQTEKQMLNTQSKRLLNNHKHNVNHQHCIDHSHKPAVKPRMCSKTLEKNNRNISKKGRNVYDIMEVHSKDFIPPIKPFTPRILKSDAEPRIRNLRVYYPPRKKPTSVKKSDVRHNESVENCEEVCEVAENISAKASTYSTDSHRTWNAVEEVQFLPDYIVRKGKRKLGSELSSCDSAYNGGISSGGESRGSSPEQNQNPLANMDSETDKENDGSIINKSDSTMHDPYLQFTNSIINMIIKNNTLSGGEIKDIIKQCISEHENKLDKVRMYQEVEKLMVQLDIDTEDQPQFSFLGNNESCENQVNKQNFNVVNNSDRKTSLCNDVKGGLTLETDVCDPFDDDVLLQEYKSELRKLNIDPDFIFPSSGGVEMTVEYMCDFPFTENATSQDLLEEELWIHPYKNDISNMESDIGSSKCNVGCDDDGRSESDQTLHCLGDISNLSSNIGCLLPNNLEHHVHENEQASEPHLLHDITEIHGSGYSDSSEVSVLSELFIGCRLNDS